MPKTIRNSIYKYLSYEKLMEAHNKSRKGKGYRKEIIEFNFILNSKNISIVRFNLKLLNGSIIKVKGYNEIADYCYSKLKEDDIVEIEGNLDCKMVVVLKVIGKLN